MCRSLICFSNNLRRSVRESRFIYIAFLVTSLNFNAGGAELGCIRRIRRRIYIIRSNVFKLPIIYTNINTIVRLYLYLSKLHDND